MVFMNVLGCQMGDYSRETVDQKNMKRFLGNRQATLQTGQMMDSGLTTGEWWNLQKDNQRINSGLPQLLSSALALGQELCRLQRGLGISLPCTFMSMSPLLSHCSLSNTLYLISRGKSSVRMYLNLSKSVALLVEYLSL